jgi:hypothetical protein
MGLSTSCTNIAVQLVNALYYFKHHTYKLPWVALFAAWEGIWYTCCFHMHMFKGAIGILFVVVADSVIISPKHFGT